MAQITWGQSTHIGLVRSINEDSVISLHFAGNNAESRGNFGLFIVADGLGYKGGGARASAIAVRTIAENLIGVLLRQTPLTPDQGIISNEIVEAIQAANLNVFRTEVTNGSTATVAIVTDNYVSIGHVGDSAAYQIVNGSIKRLTEIHDFANYLIKRGVFKREDLSSYPHRNPLYRALGQSEPVEVDTITCDMLPGSHLVLCSDGLSNLVKPDELMRHVTTAATPQQACDDLIALANSRGGYDNISVIVIRA